MKKSDWIKKMAKTVRTEAYNEGKYKRYKLLSDGLSPETMHTNTYSGKTWVGLYAYMDGMEGR